MQPTEQRRVLRVGAGREQRVDDHLAAEAPLEIRLGDTPIAVLMRTPGCEADLALGFAITEGIILRPNEITGVRRVPGDDEGNRWEIQPAAGVVIDAEQFRRNLYTSSSCGVCGKASIDAVRIAAPPLPDGPVVDRAIILSLPERMADAQESFALTGGLHAAAAFTPGGELLAVREDIGRHNAVDKLVGALAVEGWPLPELVLLVSGRISFEMVQKAAVAGIPLVCGVSAASSLAVDLADELGVTVIGFLKSDGFNVYSGEQRVV
ncbi:MAG: formate dehydrogenase accessory sulfurtransferase FdhD [Acidimicrobiia bacterium]|nr:formate dehydrogenase accessory sulfurtransferase FdhD [Acidimicrobiia bacterium]